MRQDKSGFKVTFEVLYGSGTEGNILLHCGLKDTMERHYSSLTVQDPIVARIPNIFRSPRILSFSSEWCWCSPALGCRWSELPPASSCKSFRFEQSGPSVSGSPPGTDSAWSLQLLAQLLRAAHGPPTHTPCSVCAKIRLLWTICYIYIIL